MFPAAPSTLGLGGGGEWSSRLASFRDGRCQLSEKQPGPTSRVPTCLGGWAALDCQSPGPCPPVSNTSGTAAFPLLLGWSSIKAACQDESTLRSSHSRPQATCINLLPDIGHAPPFHPFRPTGFCTRISPPAVRNNHVYPANNYLQGRHLRGRRQSLLPAYDIGTRALQHTDMQSSNLASHTR